MEKTNKENQKSKISHKDVKLRSKDYTKKDAAKLAGLGAAGVIGSPALAAHAVVNTLKRGKLGKSGVAKLVGAAALTGGSIYGTNKTIKDAAKRKADKINSSKEKVDPKDIQHRLKDMSKKEKAAMVGTTAASLIGGHVAKRGAEDLLNRVDKGKAGRIARVVGGAGLATAGVIGTLKNAKKVKQRKADDINSGKRVSESVESLRNFISEKSEFLKTISTRNYLNEMKLPKGGTEMARRYMKLGGDKKSVKNFIGKVFNQAEDPALRSKLMKSLENPKTVKKAQGVGYGIAKTLRVR